MYNCSSFESFPSSAGIVPVRLFESKYLIKQEVKSKKMETKKEGRGGGRRKGWRMREGGKEGGTMLSGW